MRGGEGRIGGFGLSLKTYESTMVVTPRRGALPKFSIRPGVTECLYQGPTIGWGVAKKIHYYYTHFLNHPSDGATSRGPRLTGRAIS